MDLIETLRKYWGPSFENNFSWPHTHYQLQFGPKTRRVPGASPSTPPTTANVIHLVTGPLGGEIRQLYA